MDVKEILSCVDHTLLTQTATWQDIRTVCDDGLKYGVASVCIPPSFVRAAAEHLGGSLAVCTVIGFPNGYCTERTKCFEAEDALKNGADEIDMVIDLGMVKEKRFGDVLHEIKALRAISSGRILKVIVETCLLTEEEKILMCDIVSESGADYIKTSTGFSTGGATFEDVRLFAERKSPELKIKAAGGISSLEDAGQFIELGASRLGTSRIIKIIKAAESEL